MENSCKLNINQRDYSIKKLTINGSGTFAVFLLNNIYSYIVIKIFDIYMIFMFTYKV